MRLAILSDIHANRLALDAVRRDMEAQDVERCWFLGDAVGYGPEPVDPLLFVKRFILPDDWVLGNHDAMLSDLLLPDDLAASVNGAKPFVVWERDNEGKSTGKALYRGHHRGQTMSTEDWEATGLEPIRAIELNRGALAADDEADAYWRAELRRERLAPRVHKIEGVDHVLVHGGQVSNFMRYIYSWQTDIFLPAEFKRLAEQAQASGCPRVQWYGHTHVPTLAFAWPDADGFELEAVKIMPGETYPLKADLVLINPGSVGQPRDLDQRAAYAIWDTVARTVTFRRVDYPWQETAWLLAHKGYPDSLIARLRDATPVNATPEEWLAHYRLAREAGR